MKKSEIQDVSAEVLAPEQRNGSNPTTLLEVAIKHGSTVETIERLMDLQLKWDANQTRKQFFESLSAFQNDMPVVTKNKAVSFNQTKYNYATLDNIIAEIKHHLHKHGLSYSWKFDDVDKIIVTCTITHIAGHSESTTMSASPDTSGSKNPIQTRGSALTYLQRYTLIGALGIGTAQDDTDAVEVKSTPDPTKKEQEQPKQKTVLITDFKDHDALMAWAIVHPKYNDPAFQEKLNKQIEIIKGGNK